MTEILGAIFSILGAILMSKSTKKDLQPLYYAFVSFSISNLFLLYFFSLNGFVPIAFQMLLFFYAAIAGILSLTKNRSRDLKIITIILLPYSLFFVFNIFLSSTIEIDWTIEPLQFFTSFLAIVGSYLLKNKNHLVRGVAFGLFLVADILFVYIGLENSMYFFALQSMVFIITSTIGLKNTVYDDVLEYFRRRKQT